MVLKISLISPISLFSLRSLRQDRHRLDLHFVGRIRQLRDLQQRARRMMGAEEAERSGLVAKVVPAADLIDEALKTAETIAGMAPLAAIANKEMVNAAFEMGLAQGINFERRLFHGLFGTEDQKEGMTAFVEKRPGNWTGK